MKYREMVHVIAQRTGYHPDIITHILEEFALAVSKLRYGDKLRTPLGLFRYVYKHEYTWRGLYDRVYQIPARVRIHLRPSKLLKSDANQDKWPFYFTPEDQQKHKEHQEGATKKERVWEGVREDKGPFYQGDE